jgi:hypothetical protein
LPFSDVIFTVILPAAAHNRCLSGTRPNGLQQPGHDPEKQPKTFCPLRKTPAAACDIAESVLAAEPRRELDKKAAASNAGGLMLPASCAKGVPGPSDGIERFLRNPLNARAGHATGSDLLDT